MVKIPKPDALVHGAYRKGSVCNIILTALNSQCVGVVSSKLQHTLYNDQYAAYIKGIVLVFNIPCIRFMLKLSWLWFQVGFTYIISTNIF